MGRSVPDSWVEIQHFKVDDSVRWCRLMQKLRTVQQGMSELALQVVVQPKTASQQDSKQTRH